MVDVDGLSVEHLITDLLVQCGVMAQDNDLVRVVDVGLVEGLLLERASIDQENVLEPGDLVPYLRVNLVTSSFIWLTSDDDDLLQLDVFKVLCSQGHDETLDG